MIQQTSLYSYAMLVSEPQELSRRQTAVYEAIKILGTTTDKRISQFLHWPINTVTPRRGELVKLGVVQKCGATMNEATNRPEIIWGVLK
jgi:hypothetical protein